MKKGIRITLSAYTCLALITSCTANIPNNNEMTSRSPRELLNTEKISKYGVRGKAEFPLRNSPQGAV
jgi:hypothetical protein